jgi:anti-sigma-K factor RskA
VADHDFAGLRCSDVLELAGSFVLGALSPGETDAVRRHLAACPEAHAEIAELRAVVPALFETVEIVPPPAGLKVRILAAAAAERGAGAAPAVQQRRSGGRFDLGALFRRPIWAGVAAVAVVLAVALGAWNLQLRSQVDGLTAYRTGVVRVLDQAAKPGAQLAVLVAPQGPAGPTGLAAIGSDGTVGMVMRDLAPTTGTQVYTAWLIGTNGAPVPIGEFKVDDSRTASFTTTHASLGPSVTVALSLEPQAGAKTPTTVVAAGAAQAQSS